MPLATTVTDQANLERRLWDLREALPQVVFDMSRPATVTVVAGAVSTLADVTGRYSVAQATSGDRPTYTPDAQNGLPVATGNGTGRRLTSASNAGVLNNVPGYTLYAVGRANADSVASGRSLLSISNTGTGNRAAFTTSGLGTGYGAAFRRLDGDGAFSLNSSNTTNLSQYRTVAMRLDALSISNNATLIENGAQTAIGTRSGSASNTSATNPLSMLILADATSSTNTGPFAFAAAAIFHEAHPVWLRQKAEGRMAHSWGLAGSLAIGHACRSRPPLLGPG